MYTLPQACVSPPTSLPKLGRRRGGTRIGLLASHRLRLNPRQIVHNVAEDEAWTARDQLPTSNHVTPAEVLSYGPRRRASNTSTGRWFVLCILSSREAVLSGLN